MEELAFKANLDLPRREHTLALLVEERAQRCHRTNLLRIGGSLGDVSLVPPFCTIEIMHHTTSRSTGILRGNSAA